MTATPGAQSLHRLIYASAVTIPPQDLDDSVSAIIQASIRNNRQVSVTGLLLIHEGCFVQALEGPTEAVLDTYGRIQADPRHAEARVLQAGPAAAREFGDWNMCARRMSPADDAILDALAQRRRFDPSALTGRAALRLLMAVRGIQHRTDLRRMA